MFEFLCIYWIIVSIIEIFCLLSSKNSYKLCFYVFVVISHHVVQTQKTGDYFNTSVPLVSENHAIATLHLEQRAALDEQQVQLPTT
ncbi:hypothetical protein [Iodobacter fluviatilis]|uniref:Uncharacterized protein n=1 Tax=Iodobacter fluviatilis TaxID=537 RepID=A0A7G3GBF3_9NEIS|nr:hypothetical protein [Iodobacter fluviatilis]QBC44586.1 hypothetical protein C1H71_14340 [Iodobacter fluviatilis]